MPITSTSTAVANKQSAKETFTDPRDSKTYQTVTIGNQVWMAENLNHEAEGSKCHDPKYGRLYDWETAKKACPPGWHLPDDKEWQDLVDFAGGKNVAGKKLKATSDWNDYGGVSGNGTDDYGFSALPGGDSFPNGKIGEYGTWWSASENSGKNASYLSIHNDDDGVHRNHDDKSNLLSVRCIKD